MSHLLPHQSHNIDHHVVTHNDHRSSHQITHDNHNGTHTGNFHNQKDLNLNGGIHNPYFNFDATLHTHVDTSISFKW